ncbi:iron chelate uptake ABC transporter family permease subunit [Gilliamella sp. B2776]|uniref:ABC transporter permease n=1 Tax=unclassified Gilliamella TaxID=2685620 RepID=UPI002269BF61|nr:MULTISPECIES: iron chelate uptake ABC transporter family permease subunit [unclassified Gilliamella]MCX8650286.1 iron chelate uptake ABC transporter family permease subunit [Gilliamella sp. B2779]MCX8654356.1 iron chelate uptake ABC transporter family permease subunit [Gilliamella sp. B2737]MCX8655996.1 iron chelate uptake ABC transporter family permease subunit [Gilliamella sp. B2894]MCX8664099.1 iron chelate uptake ABC transporter family permease subunit [Gilliamella sp. B2887]MCX8692059.
MTKRVYFIAGIVFLLTMTALSLFIGAGHVKLVDLWSDSNMQQIFFVSRVSRTVALLLAGSAMSIAGLIMQLLTQNRFVEPSLVGTTQSASLGLLVMMVLAPGASVMMKMLVASLFAMAGTVLFMFISRKIIFKTALMVPLIGMMLGAVISAICTFFAMYFDLLQSLVGWESGDFSGILQGRYELLWLVGGITLFACWSADRFTVAGLGRDFSVNVGLNYNQVMLTGLIVVALIGGIVVVVVGVLPFLGLIVPNIVSLMFGDNVRKTIPWICLFGSGLVLLCDIIGRVIRYPFEIPVSVILGVVGAIIFLVLLSTKRHAS